MALRMEKRSNNWFILVASTSTHHFFSKRRKIGTIKTRSNWEGSGCCHRFSAQFSSFSGKKRVVLGAVAGAKCVASSDIGDVSYSFDVSRSEKNDLSRYISKETTWSVTCWEKRAAFNCNCCSAQTKQEWATCLLFHRTIDPFKGK